MGYTKHSYDLMKKYQPADRYDHLMLGDQICYFGNEYGTYMGDYFRRHHPKVRLMIVDIKPEPNGCAYEYDLRSGGVLSSIRALHDDNKVKHEPIYFDLICDMGTTEHVAPDPDKEYHGLYEAHKHIYEMCKVSGVMIHENPKTGNWKGHGFWYKTKAFYHSFADMMGLELLEVGEHPAMGNTRDGWNVFAVLKKVDQRPFMSLDDFEALQFLRE